MTIGHARASPYPYSTLRGWSTTCFVVAALRWAGSGSSAAGDQPVAGWPRSAPSKGAPRFVHYSCTAYFHAAGRSGGAGGPIYQVDPLAAMAARSPRGRRVTAHPSTATRSFRSSGSFHVRKRHGAPDADGPLDVPPREELKTSFELIESSGLDIPDAIASSGRASGRWRSSRSIWRIMSAAEKLAPVQHVWVRMPGEVAGRFATCRRPFLA